MAVIDYSLLKQYLEKKKQLAKAGVTASGASAISAENNTPASPAWKLRGENLSALQKFTEQLKLKAYSTSTIKTYRNEFLQLLKVLKKKPAYDLTTDDLRRYMLFAMEKQGIGGNTAHSRLNALKF